MRLIEVCSSEEIEKELGELKKSFKINYSEIANFLNRLIRRLNNQFCGAYIINQGQRLKRLERSKRFPDYRNLESISTQIIFPKLSQKTVLYPLNSLFPKINNYPVEGVFINLNNKNAILYFQDNNYFIERRMKSRNKLSLN